VADGPINNSSRYFSVPRQLQWPGPKLPSLSSCKRCWSTWEQGSHHPSSPTIRWHGETMNKDSWGTPEGSHFDMPVRRCMFSCWPTEHAVMRLQAWCVGGSYTCPVANDKWQLEVNYVVDLVDWLQDIHHYTYQHLRWPVTRRRPAVTTWPVLQDPWGRLAVLLEPDQLSWIADTRLSPA
jgi:hypothetical protein